MNQQTFWGEPEKPGKLIFELTVSGRLPSWNDILALDQWGRYKLKGEMADTFLSELRASGAAYSIRITSVANTLLTYADTLEFYLRMRREQRKLKSGRKRLEAKSRNAPKLRSSSFDNPPF